MFSVAFEVFVDCGSDVEMLEGPDFDSGKVRDQIVVGHARVVSVLVPVFEVLQQDVAKAAKDLKK